jgi:hypothetical protein
MTTNETIIKALDVLCDALDLGHSESSTEVLFTVLSRAFSPANVAMLERRRKASHKEGLMLDMRGDMAEAIEEAL